VSVLPVLLVVLPLVGAAAVALWPGPGADALATRAGVVLSGVVLAVALAVLGGFDLGAPGRMQMQTDVSWVAGLGLHVHLGVDGVSLPLVLLTALLVFACMLYGMRHVPAPGRPRALVALLLLVEGGVLGTFLALDLLLFFVFFEVVLVPMYVVVAVWGGPGRTRAAAKLILVTLLGSALMLVGFLVVWTQTGTLDMVVLAHRGGAGMSRGVQTLAFLAMGAGFAVKAPLWPLHTWLPDAHTEAPTVGSVLLAGVLLKIGTYGFVRIALPEVPQGARVLAPWLGTLAVAGILYGSLVCLAQTDLKRLVAYSSVGHMGFVLLGIATLTPVGVNGALFANVGHGLVTGLLFFLVGGVEERTGTTDVAALGRGVYVRAPRLGALLTFGAVASLGLPGLAGFWGEMLAMFGAFRPAAVLDRPLFLVLLAGAGVGAVLTAAYLLTMVRRVMQGPPEQIGPRLPDVVALEWAAWAPLVVLAVVVGLWPRALLGLTDPAVRGLLGAGP